MLTVKNVLDRKGGEVHSIPPDATVYEALARMAEKSIGALVVVEDGKIVGIMSERDYARKVILVGKTSKDTAVREIMSTRVYYVVPDQKIDACMALMTEKAIRHLPVLDGEELVGIISIGDVVKAMISEQEFIIEQLEMFITGR